VNTEIRVWVSTLFRLVLAGVWLWTGIAKMVQPGGARSAIIAYRVFPAWSVDVLGYALPAAEILLGALLLIGMFTRWASLATAVFMVGFMLGITSVWIRGYSIECGCGGGGGDVSEDGKVWRYTSELLRDFLFTGLAVWLVAWPRTKFSIDRWHSDDFRDSNEVDSVGFLTEAERKSR
jgi:uncharacterized membrane protein YphA (DoxX/SURF4 family)